MEWIPVTERMPKASDEMNHIDDVLVYIPPYDMPPLMEGMKPMHSDGGIYLGHPKVTPVPADEKGEGNLFGIPIERYDWIIWGYSYFCGAPKPTHWMPLPDKPGLERGMISYEPPKQEAFGVDDYINGLGTVLDPDNEVMASLMESIGRQTKQIDDSIRATTAQIARGMGEIK